MRGRVGRTILSVGAGLVKVGRGMGRILTISGLCLVSSNFNSSFAYLDTSLA